MLNLATTLETSRRRHPDREAVVCGDARLTYAHVDAAARRVATLLTRRGLGPGDKVCLICPNLPQFPIVYYGALMAGCVIVPLNPLLKRDEIAYHLRDSDAKALFCFAGTPDLNVAAEGWAAYTDVAECVEFFVIPPKPGAASPIEGAETLDAALADCPSDFETVATSPADTAVIIYTSGTTGRPKGAELTHSNMVQNAQLGHRMFSLSDHETHLVALPLFHIFAESTHLNSGFAQGSTLVLLPRFDAGEALRLMREERVTLFAGVPTMYWGLLNHPDAADGLGGALRVAISGGAPIARELLTAFQDRFGVTIYEGYGMSETSPTTIANEERVPVRSGSIGKPVWGVEAKLIDADWNDVGDGPGELAVRGHGVMKGYYKRPEATAEVLRDGWLRTGDIARRDEDGYFYIIDRAKELIIRGGYNVYPREVEETLMEHPDVSLVAVIGVPHERHGEEVKAVVVRESGSDLTAEELIEWARERMAAYKYPRVVEFREEMPLTATGKIRKPDLR